MNDLLLVALIYAVVYCTDYLFYLKQGAAYQYVSRRTYLLLISGQIAVISLLYSYFTPFFQHIGKEITLILILWVAMTLFTTLFHVNRLLICHTTSRTERCLTPAYIAVRGADIVFQQLAYVVTALAIKDMFGLTLLSYLLFTVVLVIMHTPVALSTNKSWFYLLTIGIAVLSVPFFYIYTSLGLFWPGVYIHSIVYVFMWLAFADLEGVSTKTGEN